MSTYTHDHAVAFAFAVPNGRTTQVFVNMGDNSATHDGEPFVTLDAGPESLGVKCVLAKEKEPWAKISTGNC